MVGLKKIWRREVAAVLLLLALVASGRVALLNNRNAADGPVGPFGSAAVPEDPILTPDVWEPDLTETPTMSPLSATTPTPTPMGSQTLTSSTSSRPPAPKRTTTPQLTAVTTPEPSTSPTTTPAPQPTSRTITTSTTPRGSYTEIVVTGGGCAGERYGVNLEMRDSTGEPIDGDGAATTPNGSWQLEQHWGAEKPAGRYSFHAKCIHSPEEGGQTTVFEYKPAVVCLSL